MIIMGVKHLWSILQPVCKKEPLESMRGKTLCVDLSTWICQAEETMPLKNAVQKPYLRNTIFRVICLKRLGTRLIFLTEGTPPELKWNAILSRANQRAEAEKEKNGNASNGRNKFTKYQKNSCDAKQAKPKKVGRSAFQRKINECAQLLKFLGLPVIKSEGEAEACCAFLDKNQFADGCITQDGDTFLYGGEVVYRNLGISSKDPHVYCYSMSDAESILGIDRQQMVALALLLGCDYCDGVSGVGKQTALKLLAELNGIDILERFRFWEKEKKVPDEASSIERQVFRKVMKTDGFLNEKVIDEFLNPRDEIDQIKEHLRWEYPDLVGLQRFCAKHMEWPEEYTLSKVLGVATNEHLNRISRGIPLKCPFAAVSLLKSRIQHGVPLCEVEWKTGPTDGLTDFWKGYPDVFMTLESQQEIILCLPSLIAEFEKLVLEKKMKGKKSKKKTISKIEEQPTSGEKFQILTANENIEQDQMFDMTDKRRDTANLSKTTNNAIHGSDLVTSENYGCIVTDQGASEIHSSLDNLVDSFSCIELNSFTDAVVKSQEKETEVFDGCRSLEMLPLRERLMRKNGTNETRIRESTQIRKTSAKVRGICEDGRCSKLSFESAGKTKGGNAICEAKGERYCSDSGMFTANAEDVRYQEHIFSGEVKSNALKKMENSKLTSNLFSCDETTTFVNKGTKVCKDLHEVFDDPISENQDIEIKERGDFQDSTRPQHTTNLDSVIIDCIESPSSSVYESDTTRGISANDAAIASRSNNESATTFGTPGSYDVVNLTSDSLGCLLDETETLFDSPLQENYKENPMTRKNTPNGDDYVDMLRQKFGIVLQKTPLNFQHVYQESPRSTNSDKALVKDISLSLMERLRNRSQKM